MKPLTLLDADSRATLLSAPTLTIPQVAAVLGVGNTSLYTALRRGEIDLPVIEIGRRRVIPSAAVRRLLGMDE